MKLGDLGLAKSAGETLSLTMSGATLGTPYYVSPEQAEGKKDVDLRADIYSLGCTIFHLVAGKPPYTGDSALAVMMKHVRSPIPSPQHVWPGFPGELARVVMKMIAKNPAARQQTYAEVLADLRRAYDAPTGETVAAGVAVTQQPQKPEAAARPAGPKVLAAEVANPKSKMPLLAASCRRRHPRHHRVVRLRQKGAAAHRGRARGEGEGTASQDCLPVSRTPSHPVLFPRRRAVAGCAPRSREAAS